MQDPPIFVSRWSHLEKQASHLTRPLMSESLEYSQLPILVRLLELLQRGLKSIFETGFKRHLEPRLPSTAQINH
ncbi:hypothetical protein EFS29_09515 [Lactiplantibacillus plantarum]|nr:hypothetical protein [Lactiplantibacillus plantarum]